MPRTYKRKTDHGLVSHDAMEEAVKLVLSGMTVRKVAKDKGISRSALSRYVKKYEEDPTAVLAPNYRHSQTFTVEQEKTLEDYLVTCSQMFHGLTPKNVRKLAYEMAHKNGMKMPSKWDEKRQAGEDWFTAFLKRHPTLSIRSPEATSLARATSFNEHNINAYFDMLQSLITKLSATGQVIYNLDETGCTTVQKVPKIVSKKGIKQVGQITSRERGELVTLCGIISAAGVALPPVYIFPRKNYRDVLMRGAPEGSLGLVNASGWMTSSNFVKVLDHVVRFTGSSTEKPIIITMDNHESHIALDCVVKAKDNGIHIVTLPPHTSNKTQPLDLSVYGPLKTFLNSAANSWMMEHPGKPITIYDMAQLMGSAWLKAATPVNILSGFRLAGIWPFDRDVFCSEQFMPSLVTDRPPVEQVPETSSLCPDAAASGSPSTSAAVNFPSASEASAVPSTSFISPQEFRRYPKVCGFFSF